MLSILHKTIYYQNIQYIYVFGYTKVYFLPLNEYF